VNRDLEGEKEKLLETIYETIDPKLLEILQDLAKWQTSVCEPKVIISMEGTSSAGME